MKIGGVTVVANNEALFSRLREVDGLPPPDFFAATSNLNFVPIILASKQSSGDDLHVSTKDNRFVIIALSVASHERVRRPSNACGDTVSHRHFFWDRS